MVCTSSEEQYKDDVIDCDRLWLLCCMKCPLTYREGVSLVQEASTLSVAATIAGLMPGAGGGCKHPAACACSSVESADGIGPPALDACSKCSVSTAKEHKAASGSGTKTSTHAAAATSAEKLPCQYFTQWKGVPGAKPYTAPDLRHSVHSLLQATLSITIIGFIDHVVLEERDGVFLLASFAATAVLVHAAYTSPLSQPRNVVGGHLISSIVGVSCYKMGGNTAWAAGLAVGLSIFIMERLECLHPPGGASAIAAVIGSDRIHRLSYRFVVVPCMTAPLIMIVVALVFNNADRARTYPQAFGAVGDGHLLYHHTHLLQVLLKVQLSALQSMGGVNNESGNADYASEDHDTPPNVGYLDQYSDTLSVRSESLGGDSYISLVSLAGGSSKTSPFQDVLASSTYGKFERAVSQLDINVDKDLPKIVVCGDESNGKSSTVARFICEEIFPASRGSLTTRMPIRVVLRHALERKVYLYHINGEKTDVTDAPDISRYLKEEMDAVCAPGTISTQEIVVEIHSPGVYNAELIDLPGIVATEDLRDATEALVRSYISEPDVVIVCVVEAGLASLNNSRSLALVDALDKKQQTIVVLTKLDDIVEKNFQNVESRILECKGQYAGMVGVINRDDRDEDGAGRTLVEANAFEERWLRENLRRFLPGLRLRYNQDVGIFALLRKVDRLVHDVITQAWIPDAVHVVEQKMAEIQQREDALGPAPETYNGSITPLLVQFVAGVQCLGSSVEAQGNKFLRSAPSTTTASVYSPLSVANVRSRMEEKQLARKMASALLKRLKDMVAEHAADVLDDGVDGLVNTAHLARFHEFGASVMRVLETKSAELFKSCWDEIEFLIDLRFQTAAGSVLPSNFHDKLHAGVVENVMSQFWLPLLDVVGNDCVDLLAVLVRESVEGGAEHMLLVEAQEVAAQRAMLKALYEKHQSALDVFSIIKRTPYGASWDTPDSPVQHGAEDN